MQNKTLEKWEEKTLGDILSLEYGKALDKSYRLQNGQYKVYGANGVKDKTNKYLYDKRSIVVGRKGSAGELNYTEEKFWALDVCYYVVFDEQKYDLKFLYNLLKLQNLPTLAKGVKPGINRNDVYKLKIKIPNINEQQRIVRILDEAFENIEKAKQNALQNLNNAKELFESNLNFLFNSDNKWNEVKLEEIADITSSKRIYKSDYVKNGIPFYRTKEIKELAHNLPISIELYISEEKFNEIANKFGIPKENDLLISAVGTIGEIYVVKKNDKFYFKDGNLIWFRNIKENVNTKFLKYILRAYVKTIQNMTNGAAYNALTIEKLKIYNINLPPLEEQQKIVQQLDELQEQTKKLEQIYEQKIKDLDELKQSILQKAFNGEL